MAATLLLSALAIADAVAASAQHPEWRPFRVEWPLQIGPDTQLAAGSHLTLEQVEQLGYPAIEHLLGNGTLSFVDAPPAQSSAGAVPGADAAAATTSDPPRAPASQRKSPNAPRAR